MINIQDLEKQMKSRLSAHRFEHTISVLNTALAIANDIDLQEPDIERITLAALLHDSCKELPNEEMLNIAEFYGITIFEEDEFMPNLLHARVASAWIEEEFDILDPLILKAVEEHTLGGVEMSLISKILFLADLLEPNRSNPDLESIRDQVSKNLDDALLAGMNYKLMDVIKRNHTIHPLSLDARNFLLMENALVEV